MGKTLMDGKSKHERPSQSESFESFRESKLDNSSSGINNNNSGPRSDKVHLQRNPKHTYQMTSMSKRKSCQSPDPESIAEKEDEGGKGEGEEEEEGNSSPVRDSHFVQSNRRFAPSAPPLKQPSKSSKSTCHALKSRRHLSNKQSHMSFKNTPRVIRKDNRQYVNKPSSPPPPFKSDESQTLFFPEKGLENTSDGFVEDLQFSGSQNEKMDWFTNLLTVLSMIIVVMTFPFSMMFCLKIVAEYERAVVLRMGRLLPGSLGTRGPGLFFILPCIDSVRTVELRTVTFSIPPQEVLTRDSVTVAVDAVVYYRICNPAVSILNVEDAARSTRLLAQTTLRNVLGTKDLAQILMDREEMSATMQATIDAATEAWGVKVERVEIKDVRLPVALQRAMAAEAEAAREARARVIAANGEHKASTALKEAAKVISSSPLALQLRYLQTLCAISAEKSSTIIFPLPIDILHGSIVGTKPHMASSTYSLDETNDQKNDGKIRQWLPSLEPKYSTTQPNPRALLPGMGEPDSVIPQPIPPHLPEGQRKRYEAAELLTAAGTAKLRDTSNANQRSLAETPTEDFDDTCSDSV